MDKKANPFDFIKCINSKQGYEENLSKVDDYNSFMTNRYLSFFSDTLFFANEINGYSGVINNKQQFDFYYYLLPTKKNRYSKWIKKDDLEGGLSSKKDKELFESLCLHYGKIENGGFSRKRVLTEVFPLVRKAKEEDETTIRSEITEVTYGGK